MLNEAIRFATAAHSGQVRKGSNLPYVIHPLRVAANVAAITNSDVAAAAAVLHDVVEDCDVAIENIAGMFGDEVAGLVADLTNDNNLPKVARREAMVAKAPSLGYYAATIKALDRYDNLMSILDEPPGWTVKSILGYAGEGEALAKGLIAADPEAIDMLLSAVSDVRFAYSLEAV